MQACARTLTKDYILLAGDTFSNLTPESTQLLIDMGSPVSQIEFRASMAIVTVKMNNGNFCTIASEYNAPYQGPTVVEVTKWDMFEENCLQ